jgi:glycosyltransferase involved in cell wall biosynthesis
MSWALDRLVIWKLRPCDIFICMSGIYVAAPRHARSRNGAQIVLHRSSAHILTQKETLAKIGHAQQVSEFATARELEGYALADRIAVPSNHVVESFLNKPHAGKVDKDPYGVDIVQFPFVEGKRDPATVLYVGQWSYRKGVDVLTDAIVSLGDARLCHAGPIVDAAFPADHRFIHHDSVPQTQLTLYYRRAPVFVLASREDGFGFVLSQALASGCLVVCTDRTGGPDLAEMGSLRRLIRIVPAEDVSALADAIRASLRQYADSSFVPISQVEREQLSWRCYAEREIQFMTGSEVISTTAADALHDHSEIQ